MRELISPSRWWRYLLAAAAGFALAWWIHKPRVIVEPPAPAIELPSGGMVLERKPDAPVPTDTKRAAKEAGGVLERAATITVRPKPIQTPAAADPDTTMPSHEDVEPATAAPGCSCEPVHVDLGLIRMPDQTRRNVATSQDGEILGGIDIPIEPTVASKPHRWAAGVSYNPVQRDFGGWLDRDIGPLRVGLEVQDRHQGGLTATVRVGIRW